MSTYKTNVVPQGEHWAIIEWTSVTIPGDERSRTAPGHGYPEHTEHYVNYYAFADEAEFKREMATRIKSNQRYFDGRIPIGIHVTGVYKASEEIVLDKFVSPAKL